ncbi:MAG: hypothetical protein ACR2RL_02285, partial [Gammaproteobacteria bacterium]
TRMKSLVAGLLLTAGLAAQALPMTGADGLGSAPEVLLNGGSQVLTYEHDVDSVDHGSNNRWLNAAKRVVGIVDNGYERTRTDAAGLVNDRMFEVNFRNVSIGIEDWARVLPSRTGLLEVTDNRTRGDVYVKDPSLPAKGSNPVMITEPTTLGLLGMGMLALVTLVRCFRA